MAIDTVLLPFLFEKKYVKHSKIYFKLECFPIGCVQPVWMAITKYLPVSRPPTRPLVGSPPEGT